MVRLNRARRADPYPRLVGAPYLHRSGTARQAPTFCAGKGHSVVTLHRRQEAVDRVLAFLGERLS